MKEVLEQFAKQLALEKLMQTPAGEKFCQAVQLIQSMQQHLTALSEKEEEPEVTVTKAATVMTLAVLKKIAGGKVPSSFDEEDWKEIARAVSEYAILLEDEMYSVFVFQLYEKYIRASAASIQKIVPCETAKAIRDLADQLHSREMLFRSGDLPEVRYTEDCLWISLEAMVKLIAAAASVFGGQEAAEFTQALAACAFEYGRLMLFQKEQALVAQFIQSQYRLDEELEKKYAEYLAELEAQSNQFCALVEQAFSPDFRTAFLQSILLADAAGVEKSEILSSDEEIDSFFLD